MDVTELQALLAGIYDVPLEHDVSDFLVGDTRFAEEAWRGPETGERLLVARDGDGMALALYLEPALLERLAARDPLEAITIGSLADFWTALEGVSHFHYLAFHAGHDHEVSRFELEMQAEVDKYVATLWLLRRRAPSRFPVELHSLLFARARPHPGLPAELAALYARASEGAGHFCRWLEGKWMRRAREAEREALAQLRRWYRLGEGGKRAWLARC